MNTDCHIIKKIDTIDDLENIINIFDIEFQPKITSIIDNKEEFINKLFNNAITVVLYDDLEKIGFCTFYCNDFENKIAYISLIAIKSEYRRRGCANKILKWVEKFCVEQGMEKLKLEVYNNNTNGLEFYRKNGFVFCEENEDKNTSYMEKKLNECGD